MQRSNIPCVCVCIFSFIFRCIFIFSAFCKLTHRQSSVYLSLSVKFATMSLRESDPTGKLPGRLSLS